MPLTKIKFTVPESWSSVNDLQFTKADQFFNEESSPPRLADRIHSQVYTPAEGIIVDTAECRTADWYLLLLLEHQQADVAMFLFLQFSLAELPLSLKLCF